MRFFHFFVFLIFLVAVVIFAVENTDAVTIRFLKWGTSSPIALLIAATYVLGMLSGWTVVGFLKRSLQDVTERRTS